MMDFNLISRPEKGEFIAMSTSANHSTDVLREWRESATFWHKHYPTIRTMFAPVTKALIETAKIIEGDVVLDVAGGSGEPSLTIAELIRPRGLVTCTDAVADMVAAAKAEAEQRGLLNIEFRQCLADSLPFEKHTFDATVCRLGVMFFPDVPAALREMIRVTKSEGAIAFAVWGRSEVNPFGYLVTNVLSQYIEIRPAPSAAPGAFRFAEPGKLSSMLSEAGVAQVRDRLLNFRIEAPLNAEQFWEMRSQTSGTLREKLANLPAEQAEKIRLDVLDAVQEFFPNGQMSFPAEMLIVSGHVR
jgi:ubiquinone/menaquinone biosynthesis C-methylase UbiE